MTTLPAARVTRALLAASTAVVFAAACAERAADDHSDHEHPAGDSAGLGHVAFAVTCAPEVRARFESGVAMLHSFWFSAADSAFRGIAAADSTCAMAHWGVAIAAMGNPMARNAPSAAQFAEGRAAAERARALAGNASHREQMYIDAAIAYYGAESSDHAARMRLHEQAFDSLRRAHSDDMEASIFYARTVVANASPSDQTFAQQIRAAEILQPLFDRHPDHPGLAHYLIHAYDAPALAARAANAAKAYAGIAPSAPHALHMPSHIFTRVGQWQESIETNARSARAEPDSNGAVHPMDYMVYAYLQQGRDAQAKAVVDRAVQQPSRFYGGLMGYNFAAMPARFALERGAWGEAATLKVPVEAPPYVEAVTRFARALGAARSGRASAAAPDIKALGDLKAGLEKAGDKYWSTIVEAQRLAASAWVAQARGDTAGALALAGQAADLEETVEKHPVTPGPILPARELEGDLFMAIGRHADALAAYEKTLQREPRRARTLFGAARAAELAGNATTARARYTELMDVMAEADSTRTEPAAARKYLGGS